MVGSNHLSWLNENTLHFTSHFRFDVVLHLHCFVYHHSLTLSDNVARFNEQFDNGATHRSVESWSGNRSIFVNCSSSCCASRCIFLVSSIFFSTTVSEELLSWQWKELKQQEFLFVLSQFHVAVFWKNWVLRILIRRYVVRSFFRSATDLHTEFWINRNWSLTVFTENEVDELLRLVRIVWLASLAVNGYVYCLSTNDLACRSNQWYKTCIATNLRYKLHCFFEHVFCAKSTEVSHHVAIHTTRNFGVLNDFVWFWETEVGFDSVASVEHSLFVAVLACFDSLIELSVDFCWKSIVEWIEVVREVVFVKVNSSKTLTSVVEFFADFAHSLHVAL